MIYDEAKEYLDSNVSKVPGYVSLFIAPKGKEASGEENLKGYIGEQENKSALEKFGYLNNTDLQVYATYQNGNRIDYPTLEDFFRMHPQLKGL